MPKVKTAAATNRRESFKREKDSDPDPNTIGNPALSAINNSKW